MSNDIEGSFIEGDNEIIIAEDVAKSICSENCIGEKISLNNGNGYSVQYTIVGINHTKNPQDEIYSFISAKSLKTMLEETIKDNLYNRQVITPYFEEIQNIITSGFYGCMISINDEENLIYGSYPSSNKEILISSALVANVLHEFDIDSDYTQKEIESGKITLNDINKIFTKKFALNQNGVFELYISGIYDSNEIEMRFPKSLIDEIQIIDPVQIDIYVNNTSSVNSVKNSIEEENDFEARIQLDTLKQNISTQTMFFSAALILFSVVLICISLALLNSFSKIAVLERKREIAIIKSLGAKNKEVLFVFLYDNVIISLIALIMSMGFVLGMVIFIPKITNYLSIFTIKFPIGLVFIVNIIFDVLIILLTSFKLKKPINKMPAELLIQ